MDNVDPVDVLVIEDDMPIQRLLRHIVERIGFSCECADDGRAGLSAILRSDPRVIVLDLLVPRVNGFEVLRQLNKSVPEVLKRIIIVTAAAQSTYAACKEISMTRILIRKPIDIDFFAGEIEACYGMHAALAPPRANEPSRVSRLRKAQ